MQSLFNKSGLYFPEKFNFTVQNNRMDKVLVVDFGSQYTQLIARRIRELNIYCDIFPYHHLPENIDQFSAYVLSGSPFSVTADDAPVIDPILFNTEKPVLTICFSAQYLVKNKGGQVERSNKREFGRARIQIAQQDPLMDGVTNGSQVWMSHSDTILKLPDDFQRIASTEDVSNAAFKLADQPVYGIQFHPEVYHTTDGLKLLNNFLVNISGLAQNWTPEVFVDFTVNQLQEKIKDEKVVLGLSGGVDSSVAAVLLHQAIGKNLYCIFVNNGLLRKNEFEQVLHQYKDMGLNVKGVDASDRFLDALEGVSDPEEKRKKIGNTFIDVFDDEAHEIKDVSFLAQGTIYPDVIESVSVNGPSATIKSHHNVGGLPDYMKLQVVEPLRAIFKDEVRRVGKELRMDNELLGRHPFPGPGLAIRILGKITREKVALLQEVDDIYINELRKWNLYNDIWQAGAILLPVDSVGVMGDERTYEKVVALRAVTSTDGMTADWVDLPYEFLQNVSNKIINRVSGVNRVVYDISSKPPATIEWE